MTSQLTADTTKFERDLDRRRLELADFAVGLAHGKYKRATRRYIEVLSSGTQEERRAAHQIKLAMKQKLDDACDVLSEQL